MVNILLKGIASFAFICSQINDVISQTGQPDHYFLTINMNEEADFAMVAGTIKRNLCGPPTNAVSCKYTFKVTGEGVILAVVDVTNPIELEKRLNKIHLVVDVKVKAERVTKYEDFAENILGVNRALLVPSPNTPEKVDELIWCEITIGYNGNLTELIELWNLEAKAVLNVRNQGTKLDAVKIMGEKKVELFAELSPIVLDMNLFALPLMVNNGNNVKSTCTGLLNLDYYINNINK